jgi:hypothetical protein
MRELDQTIKRQGSFWFTALPYFMCVGCWILGLFSGVWAYHSVASSVSRHYESLRQDCARTHNVYRCVLVAVPVADEKGE